MVGVLGLKLMLRLSMQQPKKLVPILIYLQLISILLIANFQRWGGGVGSVSVIKVCTQLTVAVGTASGYRGD